MNTIEKKMDRFPYLEAAQIKSIHDAAVHILANTGVRFNNPEALELLQRHGFKTDSGVVFINETQVHKALESCPEAFVVHGRNPERNITIGKDRFALLPTCGATAVMESEGRLRQGLLADYYTACKLVQSSDQLDMNGVIMIQPSDIKTECAHLDMNHAGLTLCDKPFVAATFNPTAARDTLEMASLVLGGSECLREKPGMVAIINVASPLQYAVDQTECLLLYAKAGQPVAIVNMPLAGTTGPVNLDSFMALINAEILAGIVLCQLVNPGLPVIYGSTAAPADMRTMNPAMGSVEALQLSMMIVQMAKYYNLPCRTGGSLTDSQIPDYQAGCESALMLSTVLRSGTNFVFHACGQLAAYASMSFIKWILDEELCRNMRGLLSPVKITPPGIDLSAIEAIGIGGQFLTHQSTMANFRQLSQPIIFNRKDYAKWLAGGALSTSAAAEEMLTKRLSDYEKPPIDPILELALTDYVKKKKA